MNIPKGFWNNSIVIKNCESFPGKPGLSLRNRIRRNEKWQKTMIKKAKTAEIMQEAQIRTATGTK